MSLTHRHDICIKFFDNVRVNVGHEFAPPPTGDHLEDVGILPRRANVKYLFMPCTLFKLSEPLKMFSGRETGAVKVSRWGNGSVYDTG